MPASRFTKKADTSALKRLWERVYTSEKPKIGKVRAIRAADSTVKRVRARKHRKL